MAAQIIDLAKHSKMVQQRQRNRRKRKTRATIVGPEKVRAYRLRACVDALGVAVLRDDNPQIHRLSVEIERINFEGKAV